MGAAPTAWFKSRRPCLHSNFETPEFRGSSLRGLGPEIPSRTGPGFPCPAVADANSTPKAAYSFKSSVHHTMVAKRRGTKARATADDDVDAIIAEELHGGRRRISWRKAAMRLFWVVVAMAVALVVGAEVHAQVAKERGLTLLRRASAKLGQGQGATLNYESEQLHKEALAIYDFHAVSLRYTPPLKVSIVFLPPLTLSLHHCRRRTLASRRE